MAKATQILSLIEAHYNQEAERFTTLALQVAADEARQGHAVVANDIKKIIDHAQAKAPQIRPLNADLLHLVIEDFPDSKLSSMITSNDMRMKISRVINEFVQREKLRQKGHENRRKLLLSGPPGTGKTLTASILAGELGLPLYTVMVDKIVSKYMGETSTKLRQIFDLIAQRKGVYLFDEFDAIGGERGRDNDVGEMRRVLNSFLQFIERDRSDSLIVAVTNDGSLLDQALFRRFDDVLRYQLPSEDEKTELLKIRLGKYSTNLDFELLRQNISELSHAEITMACQDAIKETILNEHQSFNNDLVLKAIKDRNTAYLK